MLEQLPNSAKIVVPYQGYAPGWNVILYDSETVMLVNVVSGLMNSQLFKKDECEIIAMIAGRQGYLAIPVKNKDKGEKLVNCLRDVGVQVELLFEKSAKNKPSRLFVEDLLDE